MTAPFEIRNELEQAIVDAEEGKIGLDEFMTILVDSQVYMPVRNQLNIGRAQGSQKIMPLILEDVNGLNILVIFTNKERSSGFLSDYPDYQGGLVDNFGQLLLMNGTGYAVTINPTENIGLDIEPPMIEQVVQMTQTRSH